MPLPSSRLASSRLAGFGHAVPSRLVPNAEIEAMLGLSDGWIERRSGIRSRYYASEGETLSSLAASAGQQALEDAQIAAGDIAMTLLATSTPDHLLPPSAPLLAHRLGLTKSGAVDLAGACGGFVYALALADGFVRTQGKAVLVVAANILSRRINPEERNSAILFADGAGAVVLAPCYDGRSGIKSTVLTADGSGYALISIPTGGSSQPFTPETPAHGVLMTMGDGREVFTRAVDMMTQSAQQAMTQAGLAAGDIDRFIPHQANARMCDKVRQNLGLEAEKMVSTMAEFGNSSAATIPLSLSVEHRRKPLQPGEQLLFTAAGAGFTGGAIVLTV